MLLPDGPFKNISPIRHSGKLLRWFDVVIVVFIVVDVIVVSVVFSRVHATI